MPKYDPKYEWRQTIFRAIKPYFIEKMGKFTHQKISEDWHFRGLAFVRDDMTYVFGFNVGFFRKNKELPDYNYDYVGCNVLVRTNGINEALRKKYKDFFEQHLSNWILKEKETYTSFRGGVGIELPRIMPVKSFVDDEEIKDFIKTGIKELSRIWPYIAANPENIFTNVVRGNPPWDETILELALLKGVNSIKQ